MPFTVTQDLFFQEIASAVFDDLKTKLSACRILEPPYCQKTHCPHHTVFGFAGCSKALVPGKCKFNLGYIKRKKEREEKELARRLSLIPEKYLPISDYSKGRIAAMSKERFEEVVKKWNNV